MTTEPTEPTMRTCTTCQQDRCKHCGAWYGQGQYRHNSPQPRWCAEWTERKRGGFNKRDNGGFRNERF